MVLLFQPYKVKLSTFQTPEINNLQPYRTNQCPLVSNKEELKGWLWMYNFDFGTFHTYKSYWAATYFTEQFKC